MQFAVAHLFGLPVEELLPFLAPASAAAAAFAASWRVRLEHRGRRADRGPGDDRMSGRSGGGPAGGS